MNTKDAVELAYIEFQKDYEDGEETNQWLKNVIDGLKQAEKELKALKIIKQHIISPKYDRSGIYVEKNGDFYEIKLKNGANCLFTEEEFKPLEEVFKND